MALQAFYAVLWEQAAGPPTVAHHAMTAETYQVLFDPSAGAVHGRHLVQGKAGQADIVVPLAPADAAVQPGRNDTGAEFTAALAPAAKQKLADADPLKGG